MAGSASQTSQDRLGILIRYRLQAVLSGACDSVSNKLPGDANAVIGRLLTVQRE